MGTTVVEAGTPEAVAFRLMERIMALQPGQPKKDDVLRLYAECLAAVRGPMAQDLLEALNFDE